MRYLRQDVQTNVVRTYKKYLEGRGIDRIIHYSTVSFKYPTAKDAQNFETINHIWTTGDRFFKLADRFYDDPTKWWVIALFNQKPTEFHAKAGDIIYVPTPLESVLYYLGY